jgi:hypothetical protein
VTDWAREGQAVTTVNNTNAAMILKIEFFITASFLVLSLKRKGREKGVIESAFF